MHRFLSFTAAGFCLASVLAVLVTPWDLLANKPDPASSCGNHGTQVQFLDTPSEAAQQAKKEQKLVFVLHVSGYFEDPKLT